MNQEFIVYLGTRSMLTAAEIVAPILIATMTIGVLIAVLQSATQIQEMTLTFIPKIAVAALILLLLGSWMGSKMITFTVELFRSIPALVR